MKAEIVHNTQGEPRVLLTLETPEERKLFVKEPDLELIMAEHVNTVLTHLSFGIQEPDMSEEEYLSTVHCECCDTCNMPACGGALQGGPCDDLCYCVDENGDYEGYENEDGC